MNLPTITARISSTGHTGAPTWVDVSSRFRSARTARGRSNEFSRIMAGKGTFVFSNADRTFDRSYTSGPFGSGLKLERLLSLTATWSTPQSVRLPGTAGNYISTPDSAALSVLGDLTMIWYGSADDWSPAAAKDLISKENPSTQRSYLWDIQPTGLMFLRISPDGSSSAFSSSASAVIPFADGTLGGLAVAWRASDGRTQFFTTTSSLAAVKAGTATWTQLGTDRTVNAGSIFNSPSLLTIGARGDTGTNEPFLGNVQYAEVRNGLATLIGGNLVGGTVVASPTFRAPSTSKLTATTVTDPQGNVFTLQGTAAIASTNITYPIFTGYIDKIGTTFWGNKESVAVIEATDFFKVLAGVDLPGSVYGIEVADDGPALWWRLGEPAGSTMAYDASGHGRHGAISGGVTMGAASLPTHEPDTAASFTQTAFTSIGGIAYYTTAGGGFVLTGTTPWALELWLMLNANPTAIQMVAMGGANLTSLGSGDFYALQINDVTRLMNFMVANTAGTIYQLNFPTALNAGQRYHIVITHAADRVLRGYIDGVLVATGDTTAGTIGIPLLWLGSPTSSVATNAVLDEFAAYTGTIPSAARIAAHNAAGRTPWINDTPGTRLVRIFELVGSPGDYEVDPGVTLLPSTDLGQTVLAHAQKVEEAEGGLLYVQRDGVTVFRERSDAWNQPTKAVLGDAPAAEQGYKELSYAEDENTIFNVVSRTRLNGSPQTVRDQASIDDYFDRPSSTDGLWLQTDAEALDRSNWFLANYKDSQLRPEPVTITPGSDPMNLFPLVLDAELWDRYGARKRPQGIGVIDQTVRLERISLAIDPDKWSAQWVLSPAETGWIFQLDMTDGPGLDFMALAY